MYTTSRCFVVGMPLTNGEWLFNVTAKDLSGGAYRVRFLEDKICVMTHAFKSTTGNNEDFEKGIFKEVFEGLRKKMNKPIYFSKPILSTSEKTWLLEMGATEGVEVEHAWDDVNIIKLEVEETNNQQ